MGFQWLPGNFPIGVNIIRSALTQIPMVDVYVLESEGGYYYVGRTDNGEKRLKQHVMGKGAKWTKKHKPKRIVNYLRNVKPSDEKKIAERMIKKHGAKKVRGGPYVKTKMTQAELRALERKVGMKSTTKRKVTCGKCGRPGHIRTKCRNKTTVDGVTITTKSWVYRPKPRGKKVVGRTKKKDGTVIEVHEDGSKTITKPGKKMTAKSAKKRNVRHRTVKNVICARCKRIGHASKDCTAKTILDPKGPLAKMERDGLPIR
jgi:putative endonuclease